MDRVPGLPGSAACRRCGCCCYRSRLTIGINILYNESNISWWPDFMRFRFCVDLISRDFVLCWPDFTMLTRFQLMYSRDDSISWDFVFVLTRFHEISFLCWPDFTMLIRFHEIYSRHHINFDFCYNLAPQYTASLCVICLRCWIQWAESYFYTAILVDLL